jgi:hypothetical protein
MTINRTRTQDGTWHLHITIGRVHFVLHWMVDVECWRERQQHVS